MIKIIDKKTNYSLADYNAIDNIKALALDVAECFNKEFSYNNYSCSYILYLLYTKFLNYDLNNLSWINQDQFITNLDIAFLIKSIKFMCNFISLEELKQNKLEYCKHNLSYAVGCCLKEKYLNEKYIINKKKSLISYYTYFLCNIDDLISNEDYEAISYAGLNKLNKLIIIGLESHESKKTKELFKLCGFDINSISFDNLDLLDDTIKKCQKTSKPSIIFLNTNKENETIKLERTKIKEMKERLGIRDIPFTIYNENKTYVDSLINKNNKIISDWYKNYNKYQDKFKEKELLLNDYPDEKSFIIDKINSSYIISNYNNIYLNNFISKNRKYFEFKNFNNLIGETACSLANNNEDVIVLTDIKKLNYILDDIKNCCINNIKILYIIEKNSYQDEEFNETFINLSILRSIPNLTAYTPCDEKEFIGSYLSYLKYDNPSVIIIPNNFHKELNKTKIKEVENGCYFIKKEKKSKGNIIATGSELPIAIDVYKKLKGIGILVNVLSMPSQERFLQKDIKYRQKILQDLPNAVIEFSSNNSWYGLGLKDKEICGINKFYYTNNSETKEKYYKITIEDIYNKVKKLFN